MNIVRILSAQAETRADAAAIVEGAGSRRRVMTFGELEIASRCAATMLSGAGVKAGDAVLIFHPMAGELYVALLAVFRLGAVAMFIDPSAGVAHIERCCEIKSPKAFLGTSKANLLRLRSAALRRIPLKYSTGSLPLTQAWKAYGGCEPMKGMFEGEYGTAALLTFTSGSTGRPKAAMRSHGFLMAQRTVLQETLKLREGEKDLTTLPIFLLANLAAGVTSVIPDGDLRRPGFINARPVIEQAMAENVETTVASPALLERLAEAGVKLPSLRRVYTGGAPVFPRTLEKLAAMAPEARIVAVYGSTEAEPIAEVGLDQISPAEMEKMSAGGGLLAGEMVGPISLRILKQQWGRPIAQYSDVGFARDCIKPGEAGEIVVAGDHVLSGYMGGVGDQETKFRVGERVWHRTGDAGYLDERGRLWLLGRCEAKVEDGNGVLWPFAVETAALQSAAVKRAALLAIGERRVLAVELHKGSAGADSAALRSLLGWAKLDSVEIVKAIPVDKRHNAKVDYPALRKLLG